MSSNQRESFFACQLKGQVERLTLERQVVRQALGVLGALEAQVVSLAPEALVERWPASRAWQSRRSTGSAGALMSRRKGWLRPPATSRVHSAAVIRTSSPCGTASSQRAHTPRSGC